MLRVCFVIAFCHLLAQSLALCPTRLSARRIWPPLISKKWIHSLGDTAKASCHTPTIDNVSGNIKFPDWLPSAMGLWKEAVASVKGHEGLMRVLDASKGDVTEAVVKELTLYMQANLVVPREVVNYVLHRAMVEFEKEMSCVEVEGGEDREVVIVGDTHGQFHDVLTMFKSAGGLPNDQRCFVFNGDLVDRGEMSVETFLLACAWKCARPHSVYVLRGNHETFRMTQRFGFLEEVLRKYDQDTYFLFQRAMRMLPLCATVGVDKVPQVFVCHGGIGKQTHEMSLEELGTLQRFKEPWEEALEREDAVAELLWADPIGGAGTSWPPNRSRNLPGGYMFNEGTTQRFLNKNGLHFMVRSHQVAARGYESQFGGLVHTVFSAPNYCGGNNTGAIMKLRLGKGEKKYTPDFVQYT